MSESINPLMIFEKFEKTIRGESLADRKKRLSKFLTKEKLENLCNLKYSVRKIAQELGVSDDAITEALKNYNLETKCKKSIRTNDEDRFDLIDVDLDLLPVPSHSSKINDKCNKLSDQISKEDIAILAILAYCRPGKKVFEKSVALLSNEFVKNIAGYIGKIKNNCSLDEIKNANYIMELSTGIRLINIEQRS